MRFYADEWEDFIQNCGFSDVELEIVRLLRKEWFDLKIYDTLHMSESTFYRHKKRIKKKILWRIEKGR